MRLVIGDGLIGKALYYHLKKFGEAQLTTRGQIDLSRNHWETPRSDIAFICAGETSTRECADNPEITRLVNVTNTVLLAQRLTGFKVWISSERVFDGTKPNRKVDEAVCPTTEYGRQKAEAERELLSLGVTVIRFSKVLGWHLPLFDGWVRDLRENKEIHPYSNMGMAPLPVSFVVEVLRRLSEEKMAGLYQVSALKDIPYSGIAYHIANYIGKTHLVKSVEAKEGHPNTTLGSNISGLDIPSPWDTINDYCRQQGIL